MKQKRCGVTRIVMGGEYQGWNMTRASPRCSPGRQHGVQLEFTMPTSSCATVALFLLLLSPTFVWAQTAEPDKQSGPAPEQQAQQSGSTVDSATQPDAAPDPKPLMDMSIPAADRTPVEPKTNS